MAYPLKESWLAATRVCAASFGVDEALIRAPSRGRGPRPPEAAREPKIMAVHLAVVLSGCDYATLGRHIGLHRDTVAGHCAVVRQRISDDPSAEALSDALERTAALTLQPLPKREDRRAHRRTMQAIADFNPGPDGIVDFLRANNAQLEAKRDVSVAQNPQSAPSSDQRASSDKIDGRTKKNVGRAA